jgi:hypothetical protein
MVNLEFEKNRSKLFSWGMYHIWTLLSAKSLKANAGTLKLPAPGSTLKFNVYKGGGRFFESASV